MRVDEQVALRREYGQRYADEISRAVAQAPPWSTGQLAFLRRVFQRNQRTSGHPRGYLGRHRDANGGRP